MEKIALIINKASTEHVKEVPGVRHAKIAIIVLLLLIMVLLYIPRQVSKREFVGLCPWFSCRFSKLLTGPGVSRSRAASPNNTLNAVHSDWRKLRAFAGAVLS